MTMPRIMSKCLQIALILAAGARADWRSKADAGIEKYRKGELSLLTLDADNAPLAGATVRVSMQRHDFRFGVALDRWSQTSPAYWDLIKANYNFAVNENSMKGSFWNLEEANKLYDKCRELGIPMIRGHALLWDKRDPLPLRTLTGDSLRQAVRAQVEERVSAFKGRIHEWDFNNEMIVNHHPNLFTGVYKTGFEYYTKNLGTGIVKDIFSWVHAIDSGITLTFNEFNVEDNWQKAKLYRSMVKYYLDMGIPASKVGVGLQAHFDIDPQFGELILPEIFQNNLDSLGTLGLPLQLTEFDNADTNVQSRADGLETIYRIAFGHPAVIGIIQWDFWDRSSWKKNISLWDGTNFTINAAGQRYRDLVYKQWWSDTAWTSDAQGLASGRVFYGTYRVTVEKDGKASVFRVMHPKNGPPEVVAESGSDFKLRAQGQSSSGIKSPARGISRSEQPKSGRKLRLPGNFGATGRARATPDAGSRNSEAADIYTVQGRQLSPEGSSR